jgi:hypothetical protein
MPNVMLKLLDDQFLITQDARDEVVGRYDADHSVTLDCAQTRRAYAWHVKPPLEFTGLPPELANLPVSEVWAKRAMSPTPTAWRTLHAFPISPSRARSAWQNRRAIRQVGTHIS